MKTIAELKKDKILLRNTDPLRASVSESIVDLATKIAKEELRDPTDKDVITAIKRQIKQNEGAIELIKSKGGDSSKWEDELAMFKTFLPTQMSEEETRQKVMNALATIPEAERTKKSMGRIIGMMKQFDNVDMTLVSKIVNEALK